MADRPAPRSRLGQGQGIECEAQLGSTYLGAPRQRDSAAQQVPNHVLQAHVQALHVDGVDETQAVLYDTSRAKGWQCSRWHTPHPAWPHHPARLPHPEHICMVQP